MSFDKDRCLFEHMNIIRSFQTYLCSITTSVETGKYHLPTIKKLAEHISQFYQEINNGDSDNQKLNDSSDECDNINLYDTNYFNDNKSDSSSDNYLYGDENDYDPEHDYSLVNVFSENKKINKNKISKEYLEKLIKNEFDVEEIILYKDKYSTGEKKDNPIKKVSNYISNVSYY